jgi:hypothetical protein
VIGHAGQTVERTVNLPLPPKTPAQTPRIMATVRVEPIMESRGGRPRPNDPWNRLGSVSALDDRGGGPPVEVELMRFVTGYGGPGTFQQDVTALAPLLFGERTLRLFLSTYSEEPGWRVWLSLRYDDLGGGYRRPVLAEALFATRHLTRSSGEPSARLRGTVTIPPGLARPRLRILTTGHATDGIGRNEFVSCTHILRIDDRQVVRWRPWSEEGSAVRGLNPWAGRQVIDGQEVWTSDFDRSGWQPGLIVEPLSVPVPELRPGRHTVELEVRGIRPVPEDPESAGHGYWVISAAVVADSPVEAADRQGPEPGQGSGP